MLREHFPYAVVALLFGSLGANDISVFAVIFLLVTLWIPLVNLLDAQAEQHRRQQEEVHLFDAEENDPVTQMPDDR